MLLRRFICPRVQVFVLLDRRPGLREIELRLASTLLVLLILLRVFVAVLAKSSNFKLQFGDLVVQLLVLAQDALELSLVLLAHILQLLS